MASKCESIRNLQSIADANELLQSELNQKYLKPLDEALRCRICFEYFSNCMITKCSHNYCSVCIRRYMTVKAQCPICFQDASEPELRNNRLIDEVLRAYMKIKEMLTEAVLTKGSSQAVHLEPVRPEIVQINIEKDFTQPTTSMIKTEENTMEENEVSCPVCYNIVPRDRINIHLDSCLKRTEEYSERKTLPKLVYHLLSDKDIRKKLKEHGLSTSGDRQALIRRHKNFLTLYNANCDSLTPKPVSDLLLEIEKQELEERANYFEKPIQVHKKSSPSEIEAEQRLYVLQNQSQFSALIQDVQQRQIKSRKIKLEVQDDFDYPDESLSSPVQDIASETRKIKLEVEDDGTYDENYSNYPPVNEVLPDTGTHLLFFDTHKASPSNQVHEKGINIKVEPDCTEYSDTNIMQGDTEFKIVDTKSIVQDFATERRLPVKKKRCEVMHCLSSSQVTPEKLFIRVPENPVLRRTWLELAQWKNRILQGRSVLYFCEDHFDLPNDISNFTELKIMGSVKRLMLRKGCLPSKFAWDTQMPIMPPNLEMSEEETRLEKCSKYTQTHSLHVHYRSKGIQTFPINTKNMHTMTNDVIFVDALPFKPNKRKRKK